MPANSCHPGRMSSVSIVSETIACKTYRPRLRKVTGKKPRIDGAEPDKLPDLFKQKLLPVKAREIMEMTLAINDGGLFACKMALPEETIDAVMRWNTELAETPRTWVNGAVSKVASGAF